MDKIYKASIFAFRHARKREEDRQRERETISLITKHQKNASTFNAFVDLSYFLLTVVHRIHRRERSKKERDRERDTGREISFLLGRMGIGCILDSSYQLLTVVHRIHTHKRERERERDT